MHKYALKTDEKKAARVFGRALPISNKDSAAISKAITGKQLAKGKEFVMGLLQETKSLDGKYHTKAAFEIFKLLNSVESNAEFKGLNAEKLIIHASAHEGYTFHRPRRFKLHGRKRKVTHVQVIVQEK